MADYRQNVPLTVRLRTHRIMWGTMMVVSGPVFYATYFFQRAAGGVRPISMPSATSGAVIVALGVVATGIGAASFLVPRSILRGARERLARQSAGVGVGEPSRSLYPVFQTTFVLGLALSLVVALVGLGLGLGGFPPASCIAFLVASELLLLAHFPTTAAVRRVVEA